MKDYELMLADDIAFRLRKIYPFCIVNKEIVLENCESTAELKFWHKVLCESKGEKS